MLETSDFTANYVGTNVRYKFGRAAQHMTEKCRRGYFLLIIFLLLQTPLLYLTLRGSGGTPPPPVFQNASSPVQRYALEDDIVIGILASGRLLARLDTIENTWKKHWPNSPFIYVSDNFEVFTDAHQRWLKNPNYFIPKDENNVPCANTKHGLNCKLEFMYTTMWKKWPNKKWYIRGVDDTWVHKKNILQWLDMYNASEPYFFGYSGYYNYDVFPPKLLYERVPNITDLVNYCDGGSGWIISRPILERIQSAWDLFRFMARQRVWDDLVFGWFLEELGFPECFGSTKFADPLRFTPYPLHPGAWSQLNYYCEHRHIPAMVHAQQYAEHHELIFKNYEPLCDPPMPTPAP